MSISATDAARMPMTPEDSGQSTASTMSVQQREFARHFVLNGGNGTKAAIMAGYSESSPGTAAHRLLLNAKVLAEVKRLMVVNASAYLPMAIRTLVEIMCDPETPAKDRIAAANSLLDRGGMAAPKGGVQVNVGVQVNGGEAQALIGSIWNARSARMSGIDGGMTDKPPAIEHARQVKLDELYPTAFGRPSWPDEAEGRGGVASPGSPGSGHHIPPPPAEHYPSPPQSGQYDPQAEGDHDEAAQDAPTGMARAIEAVSHRATLANERAEVRDGGADGARGSDIAGGAVDGGADGGAASAWRAAMRGVDDGTGRSDDTGGQRRPVLDYD